MSDVSKTKDLIAEARDMAEYSRGRHGVMSHVAMLDRLADALEAALASRVTVPDAATEAIERVRAAVEARDPNRTEHATIRAAHLRELLDGAPEPTEMEFEYGYTGPSFVGVQESPSRESAELDLAIRKNNGAAEARLMSRKVGPWLPVKGESNEV